MTQEDKNLLFKDLSARLPYRVLVHYCNKSHTLYTNEFVLNERLLLEFRTPDCCVELKPYLRPMSSIAELITAKEWSSLEGIYLIDWYNANHIDYRGLIEKGLAIEAPEGMYLYS